MDLARTVMRHRLEGEGDAEREIAAPSDPELLQPAGSFVSLHEIKTHRLRGCVGRLDASAPLYESVVHTAASVLKDPRFLDHRVTVGDLPNLLIEISVILPLRTCQAGDFDLETDGIFLTIGDRSGCFLPQVARETGWGREELLSRLCVEKLGLAGSAWQGAEARFQAFATDLVGPEPFVL